MTSKHKRTVALVCADLAGSDTLDVVQLPHPRGEEKVLFARQGGKWLELQRRKAEFGAWFVNDAAHSGDGLVTATPYDPRLSILALLTASETRSKFVPLDQVLAAGAARLGRELVELSKCNLGPLDALCEVRDLGDDLVLVRLDDAKATAWLAAKVDRVAAVLEAGAQPKEETSGFVASSGAAPEAAKTATGPSARSRLRAVQAVSEYVADEWALKLCQKYGLALCDVFPGLSSAPAAGAENVWAHEAEQQRLHELAFGSSAKRPKVDPEAAKKASTKQASMAKAAKGTKSITSFFGKKK